MGKSDPHVFKFYSRQISNKKFGNVAFFGQPGENVLSNLIVSESNFFYDLSLKNWNINVFPYKVDEKFDLIVCTRCAYFCKEPKRMIEEFKEMLNPGGEILVDWGLGDHWRFKDFKVGWVKNKEHEWAYEEDNKLWSVLWDNSFLNDTSVVKFANSIKRFGYDDILKSIDNEFPVIFKPRDMFCPKVRECVVSFLPLWCNEEPQLYISIILKIK